ncbi:hypothetical protein CEUSTIGMA_g12430.t1 [Chlamydomonas eustigma]|uniref:Uncharacterized protein n=1 Tax=Chlamydomonas eustigma TaxID=1157962 RepID=A0A250XPY5_9CHLO|nr:hypothetical protein CEUSTIGMA_g12430.t1 [Chlamydomonas eustigma]|eukprot:GAX85009.1 hypothetical protein CEUSTIGMA_g12430.t1 [Chlamydomonas eustigma]
MMIICRHQHQKMNKIVPSPQPQAVQAGHQSPQQNQSQPRSIQLLGDKIQPNDLAGSGTCCVQLGQLNVGGVAIVAHPSFRAIPALVRVLPCYGSEELNKAILEDLRLQCEAFEGSEYLLRIERGIEKRRRISIMHGTNGTESPMALPAHALGGVDDEGPYKDHCYLQASSLMKEGFQTLFVWAKSNRIPLPSKMMKTLTWAALNALHPLRPHGALLALSPHSCIILPG